jgi:tetratricopeptide (TPR) repeat protein
LRSVHYISIAFFLGLVALLYFGVNTTPPAKKAEMPAGQQASNMAAAQQVPPASWDSIITASKQALPEHAKADIMGIESKLSEIKDSANMIPVYQSLAKIWQEHKNFPVAANYYAQAAKLEKSEKNLNFAGQLFLDLVHNAGSQGMQVWEAEQSIACFKQSLEVNPDNDTVKMALAAAYIEGAGQTMQGVQLLLGITREKPDNVPANLMLGRLAVQSGQFDKAIGRFETILKQDPKNTEAMYFLAEAYKGKGNKTKAIELFEDCKKIVNKPEFSKEIDNYINSFK